MTIFHNNVIGSRPGPRLLILGGVHGDEYESIAAIRQLSLTLDASTISGEVQLIPIVNRPAFDLLSRTGPDQLDLARTCPGRSQGTITEQLAAEVSQYIQQADFLIDLHTGGLAAKISPLAGYMLHEDPQILNQQRLMARAFNLPVVWGTNSRLNGRTLSVARDAGVPAIYAEWGGGGGCNRQGIADYVQGCLNVMSALGMRQSGRPADRVEYVVEDSRDGSGVLQTNHPAECAGYFEPACQLLDHIQQGEILGWIHSCTDAPSVSVSARQSGVVILLRAIPAVKPGDFLGVILEADGPGEYRYE